MTRYDRQMALPEIGFEGQKKLKEARILVVGAGGLGCTLLPALAGAGIGYLRIYDEDTVEEHNLHRQTLYNVSDIGSLKAECAKTKLMQLNPECKIDVCTQRVSSSNVEQAIIDIDVVVDAADNFATTYVLSDVCKGKGIAFISASVLGRKGYVGGFCKEAPSYRAVFPHLPDAAGDCNTLGVMGSVVATLGGVEAQMVLSTVLGFTPSPLGLLVSFDFSSWHFHHFRFDHVEESNSEYIPFIDRFCLASNDCIVDLRSKEEAPENIREDVIRMTLQDIPSWNPNQKSRIVIVCASGIRAAKAAYQLKSKGYTSLAILAAGR